MSAPSASPVGDSFLASLKPDQCWADELQDWLSALDPRVRGKWHALLMDAAQVVPQAPATDWRVNVDETGLNYFQDPEAATEALHRLQLARIPARSWHAKMALQCESLG